MNLWIYVTDRAQGPSSGQRDCNMKCGQCIELEVCNGYAFTINSFQPHLPDMAIPTIHSSLPILALTLPRLLYYLFIPFVLDVALVPQLITHSIQKNGTNTEVALSISSRPNFGWKVPVQRTSPAISGSFPMIAGEICFVFRCPDT
jgi:hypothetical protein